MRDIPSAPMVWTPLVLAAVGACLAAYLVGAVPPRRSLSGIGIVASTLRAVLIPALTAAMLVFVLRLRING